MVTTAPVRTEPLTIPRPVAPEATGRPLHVVAGVVLTLALGVVLRFFVASDLWLDEALSVNIAELPLADLPAALRRDGAPPFFYFLLHGWMSVFGSGNFAARALPGLFSLVSLPVVWTIARRIAGLDVAWAAVLLLASSPFAVHYATEARMYSLVVLLVLLGILAMVKVAERPTPGALVGLGLVTGLLLLTHYWSLYLIGVVGVGLCWFAVRGTRQRQARLALAGMAGGSLLFLPWLPSFLYQLSNTGTPWAEPATFAAMVTAVAEYGGGSSNQGRALGLVFFALAGLGLFGRPLDGRRIELDLKGRPLGRVVATVFVATLAVAITVGLVTRSSFAARYTSVAFPFFLLLLALGTTAFGDRKVRAWVLAVSVVLGFTNAGFNAVILRTQSREVANAIIARATPDDLVVYCPDQLGPAVDRLLPDGLRSVTFPEGLPPERVDWVDYEERNAAGQPDAFARDQVGRIGPGPDVFLVWWPGYRTFGGQCEALSDVLKVLRPGTEQVVFGNAGYFERANVFHYPGAVPGGGPGAVPGGGPGAVPGGAVGARAAVTPPAG